MLKFKDLFPKLNELKRNLSFLYLSEKKGYSYEDCIEIYPNHRRKNSFVISQHFPESIEWQKYDCFSFWTMLYRGLKFSLYLNI